MRILHTADWHVGRKLGRIDRTAEFEAFFDEIVEIAADQQVDLTIIAGDLLDRATPHLESVRLVLDTASRLVASGGKVLAIAGNHDSPQLFEFLAPLVEPRGVILVPRIRPPDAGGVVVIPSIDGRESVSVATFPFLYEAQVVDFMEDSSEGFGAYADRVKNVTSALAAAIDPSTVSILTGHFFVAQSELGGGERKIHIGSQYAATAHAIPPSIQYAALGHVHRPQNVPGAAVPARYSGSPLALDFSERSHTKEVVVVEASPGIPAKVESIPIRSGRKLIRVEDTLDSLSTRAGEFGDAFLDVRVRTAGPEMGIAEKVRGFLPHAVMVQAVWERGTIDTLPTDHGDRSLTEMYSEYHQSSIAHGVPATDELIEALRELEDEVIRASS